VTANNIARWDGSDWSVLVGPSGTGTDNNVYSLGVYDDGTGEALYAGGSFTTAGGVTANNIARWDGSTWSALVGPSGTGTNSAVYALAVSDDGTGSALYLGGSFTTAGGVWVDYVAKWDVTDFSALDGPSDFGTSHSVYALTVYDDGLGGGSALYAGGYFTTAGGVTVNRVARWDGSAWSALTGSSGTGADDRVESLAVYDGGTGAALFVSGLFTTAGGATVNGVARWDGSDWSALTGPAAAGVDGNTVPALAVYDDGAGPALFSGGSFTTAGGLPSNNIAAWRCYSDLSAPTNPTALSSTTHTAGQWSAARMV